MAPKARNEAINKFLYRNNLKANDLARYLEQEHDFSYYKDTQFDD